MSTQAQVLIDSAATLTAADACVIPVFLGAVTGTGNAVAAQVLLSDLKNYFEGGTANEIVFTTAIATPSAFVATTFAGFASTVSGAVLMGFGTTHDVALKNRAGTTVLGVTANTTGVTMAGALAITGALSGVTSAVFSTLLSSVTALATPSALAATALNAFASTVSGASLMGFGTTNDVSLMNRAGTVVLGVGPNTTLVNIPAALTVGTTLGVSGVLTATGGLTSVVGVALKSGTAVPATAGAVAAGVPVILYSDLLTIEATSNAPTHTRPKGSLCINTGGSSGITRMYVNTDSAGTWTPFTTAG